jgi:hypothetical protein
MIHFSLNRTASFYLNEGDVFIFRAAHQVYQVFLITETYVHAMERVSERTIRLNRAIVAAPDYVYLAESTSPDRRFNSSLAEASFMIGVS